MVSRRSNANFRRGIEPGYISLYSPSQPQDMIDFNNSNGAYFDFSDKSTMWQDIAGTTTAVTTSNQLVGYVRDKSGRAIHLTSTTTGLRPTYIESGTKKFIRFASGGVVNALQSISASTVALNTSYIFMWGQLTDARLTSLTPRWVSIGKSAGGDSASNDGMAIFYQIPVGAASRQVATRVMNTTGQDSLYAGYVTTPGYVEVTTNGANSTKTYWNGTVGTTATNVAMTATNSGRLSFGIHQIGTALQTGNAGFSVLDLYGYLHLSYIPSSTDIAAMRAYMDAAVN